MFGISCQVYNTLSAPRRIDANIVKKKMRNMRKQRAKEERPAGLLYFTEQIMSMSTSIDDMLVADLPPFDVKLSKKMLSLLGMEAQLLPKKLAARRKYTRQMGCTKRSQKTKTKRNNDAGTISFSAKDADDELLSGCFDLMKDIFDPST